MPRELRFSLPPEEAFDESCIRKHIAAITGAKATEINGYRRIKQSIDARSKKPIVNIALEA